MLQENPIALRTLWDHFAALRCDVEGILRCKIKFRVRIRIMIQVDLEKGFTSRNILANLKVTVRKLGLMFLSSLHILKTKCDSLRALV